MLRQKELEWFYQYGASEIYPEAWQGFLDEIKPEGKIQSDGGLQKNI